MMIEPNTPVIFPSNMTNQAFRALIDVVESQGIEVPEGFNYGSYQSKSAIGLVWDGEDPLMWVYSFLPNQPSVTLEQVLMNSPTLFEDALYADDGTTWWVNKRWIVKITEGDSWGLFIKGTGETCPLKHMSSRKFNRLKALARWQPKNSSGPVYQMSKMSQAFPHPGLRDHCEKIQAQMHFLSTCPGASVPQHHKFIVFFDGEQWAMRTLKGQEVNTELLSVSYATAAEAEQAQTHINMEYGYGT